jgi:antirestriction protein ArdC
METEKSGNRTKGSWKSKEKVKRDLYQEVTDMIVKALEDGLADPKNWECPWVSSGGAMNHSTGKHYSGVNSLLLAMGMHAGRFKHNRWMTYKQGADLGGQVRKGEKSTPIVYFKIVTKGEEGDDDRKSFPVLKGWNVFNIDQFDGIEYTPDVSLSSTERYERCDIFIESCGVDLSFGGDVACYIPSLDRVMLPNFADFKNSEGYYSTAFHEFAHWTGSPKRLNRDLSGRFGSASYAMEELVAELASAYLCSEFGISGKLQHVDYIASWLKALKKDKYAIFTASKLAEQAAKFLKSDEDDSE